MVFAAPLDDQLARVPHWVNPFDRWANPFDDFTTATNISWFDWEGYTSSPTGSSSGDFTESQLFSASVQVALRQRLVTIRYMTFQELLADISGTWAICAGFGLCIALFGQVTLGWSWLRNELYQDPVRFAWLRALFGNSRRARDVKIVQRELLFAHAEPPNPKAQAEPPRAADSAPSSSTTKKKVAPDEPPGVDL